MSITTENSISLSILIPSHKRPGLFQRCVKSALENFPDGAVEIIVNNDSKDITPAQHDSVQYYYESFPELSQVYEFLLSKAKGKYVYFLEDDDYLSQNFYEDVMPYLFLIDDESFDVLSGCYYPTWNMSWVLRCATSQMLGFRLDDETFQLGQFIMKRSTLQDFPFPHDSHIHNDRKLVDCALNNSKRVINIPKVIYYQTTDGGDNISFPETNANHAKN